MYCYCVNSAIAATIFLADKKPDGGGNGDSVGMERENSSDCRHGGSEICTFSSTLWGNLL